MGCGINMTPKMHILAKNTSHDIYITKIGQTVADYSDFLNIF